MTMRFHVSFLGKLFLWLSFAPTFFFVSCGDMAKEKALEKYTEIHQIPASHLAKWQGIIGYPLSFKDQRKKSTLGWEYWISTSFEGEPIVDFSDEVYLGHKNPFLMIEPKFDEGVICFGIVDTTSSDIQRIPVDVPQGSHPGLTYSTPGQFLSPSNAPFFTIRRDDGTKLEYFLGGRIGQVKNTD